MRLLYIIPALFIGALLIFPYTPLAKGVTVAQTITDQKPDNLPFLTLGGGCFWCTESEYRALEGVVYTRVGYAGGHVDNPTYQDITTGKTGHAEVVQVFYNPDQITESALLEFFLTKAHDPTQLNRQGVDIGPQYRSVIFYRDKAEKQRAQDAINAAENSGAWKNPIVTTLEPLETFWPGEDYHQQYYEKYEEQNGRPHIRVIYKQQKKAE